jgi:hypothetical protein
MHRKLLQVLPQNLVVQNVGYPLAEIDTGGEGRTRGKAIAIAYLPRWQAAHKQVAREAVEGQAPVLSRTHNMRLAGRQ